MMFIFLLKPKSSTFKMIFLILKQLQLISMLELDWCYWMKNHAWLCGVLHVSSAVVDEACLVPEPRQVYRIVLKLSP